MKLRGKLLRTVPQQIEGGDPSPIDPLTVHFDPDAWYALRPNFEPLSEPIGRVRVSRADDGSLDAVAELYPGVFEVPFIVRFAIGVSGGKTLSGVTVETRLTQVSLTPRNTDHGMPLARAEGNI